MGRRVMVVASTGGHWIQLLRMRPAWEGQHAIYVTTDPGHLATVRAFDADAPFHAVVDANRKTKLKLVRQLFQLFGLMLRERPDVVISTGAAVGYFALRLGKMLGARTVWVDSIANAETMSLSGAQIGPHADLWLTQWPDVARPEGPHFKGAVL